MDQVKDVAYFYFFSPKFLTELTCVVNQTIFRKFRYIYVMFYYC